MNVKLTTKVGNVPVIDIDWCDVHKAHSAFNAVRDVLRNHKQVEAENNRPNDVPIIPTKTIYINDDQLELIAEILFKMTHVKKEDNSFASIVEDEDFNIYKHI